MKRLLSIVIAICTVIGFATADFRKDALDVHNKYRAKHHAAPLQLSNELNNFAQSWAQTMASRDELEHSDAKYGENIFASSNIKLSDSEAAKQATTDWYNEVTEYDYKTYEATWESTGHFTQIVWNVTKNVGIGIARSTKFVYVCADYDPPGNLRGAYKKNVFQP